MVQFAMLLAIEAIVCFTPLGSLPIGPIVATLSHIPVVITAIALGTGAGTLMGFMFGLFSFIVWTFTPPSAIIAFVFTPFYSAGPLKGNFWSMVICFVPRILIGFISGTVARLFNKFDKKLIPLGYTLAGILGSITNTILVLGGIYIFFGKDYANATETAFTALLGVLGMTVVTNGLLEAAIGGVLGSAVGIPLKKIKARLN